LQGQGAEQQRIAVAIDFTFTPEPNYLQLSTCQFCANVLAPVMREADAEPDPSRGACRAAGQLGKPAAQPAGLACRPAKPHAWAVRNLHALPTRREVFIDQRDAGLRATWHPEQDLVVLSVWHDDRCVGTFRMPVQDVPRLSSLLTAALGDWVTHAGGTLQPAPREVTSLSITQRLRLSRAALRLRQLQRQRKHSA
jgi:hypothetical protein